RYTSYPTAPEFSEAFTHNDLKEFYKNQSDDRPLSLYIHMPFCRSACYFCGCNTIFTSKEVKKTRYIEYLKNELNILKNHLNTKR
ncbi:coproporphyrinogen III oxidase, partial [Aliarcobacter butzleri]